MAVKKKPTVTKKKAVRKKSAVKRAPAKKKVATKKRATPKKPPPKRKAAKITVNEYGLTPFEQEFVDEYRTGFHNSSNRRNATRTYLHFKGKVKETTAASEGSRLLRNPKVLAYLEMKEKEAELAADISDVRIKQEMARLAFFDPRKLFKVDEAGNTVPKEIWELDDDTAAAIKEFDVTSIKQLDSVEGLDGTETTILAKTHKPKTYSKEKALEMLARHKQLFNDKVEVGVDEELAKLLAGMSGNTTGPPSQR